MKRNVIALGVASAIAVLAGNAFAGVVENPAVSAATTTVNAGGIGNRILFPYFTTQGDNATLINIVNTDTVRGKAVKVRFRGAGNSDDIYDFQVLMSPGDVWTAAITQNADGFSQLQTSDKTCTIPQSVNGAFTNVNRLDSTKDVAAQTREGYVYAVVMADIVDNTTVTTDLFSRVKHVNGVAPCTGAAIDALVNDITDLTGLTAAGMAFPTTGLAGDWIILNQANTAAWSGSAKALVTTNANAVFWPQTDAAVAALTAAQTADPLLLSGKVPAVSFDLPDLSTPYGNLAGPTNAALIERDQLSALLASTSVLNEYVTDDTIAAVTDLLFSQPMRRYYVAADYTATNASALSVRHPQGTSYSATAGDSLYYTANQTTVVDRLICLKSVSFRSWDREETTTSTQFVISPGVSTTYNVCGEAAVTSINNGGVTTGSALNASVARNNIEVPYTDGWIDFNLTANSATNGLPVVGSSFMRASNGAVNYGFAFPHKTRGGIN